MDCLLSKQYPFKKLAGLNCLSLLGLFHNRNDLPTTKLLSWLPSGTAGKLEPTKLTAHPFNFRLLSMPFSFVY